jgi:hypothetical protein
MTRPPERQIARYVAYKPFIFCAVTGWKRPADSVPRWKLRNFVDHESIMLGSGLIIGKKSRELHCPAGGEPAAGGAEAGEEGLDTSCPA